MPRWFGGVLAIAVVVVGSLIAADTAAPGTKPARAAAVATIAPSTSPAASPSSLLTTMARPASTKPSPSQPVGRPATTVTRKGAASATAPIAGRAPPAAAPGAGHAQTGPFFGVLQATAGSFTQLRRAGVTTVSVEIGWNNVEPEPGRYSQPYLAQIRERIAAAKAAGFSVVLDAGLQTPPQWVFALDASTRFVNQYGDKWHGSAGADVPDAVFDQSVRDAQSTYIRYLAAALTGGTAGADGGISALRVGGLYFNELHYPIASYLGHSNSFWAFSPAALAHSPVPAYRPGAGSVADSKAFLSWYLSSLDGYGVWLATLFRTAFGPGPSLQVLLPSWGLRPGDVASAGSGGLTGHSRGEENGTINEGLDWAELLPRLAPIGGVVAYTTWLDAPDQGNGTQYLSPVRYLSLLAKPLGLRVAGENTGNNSASDMARCVQRVKALQLAGMMWMNASQLLSSSDASLEKYQSLIRTVG